MKNTNKYRRGKRPSSGFQRLGQDPTVLLDVPGEHLDEVLDNVLEAVKEHNGGADEYNAEVAEVLDNIVDFGAAEHIHHTAIIHEQLSAKGPSLQMLCRLAKPLRQHRREPVHFIWVLLGNAPTHPNIDAAAEFAQLTEEADFLEAARAATTPAELDAAYREALDREVHFGAHIPDELKKAGGFMGGVVADLRRRLPHYGSDFRDGLAAKAVGSIIFLYFACLAPTLAFGVLANELTGGVIGPIEMIIATAGCGIFYGLFAGQPLTIVGGIAPVIVLISVIQAGCTKLDVPFLPALAWVGLWTMVLLLAVAAFEACRWIRFFTRFTDDTFAALISLIFVVEAIKPIYNMFHGAKNAPPATAWMSLVLSAGTFYIAINLSRFRRSHYLRHRMREFLADFGPSIAIALMTGVALLNSRVHLPSLKVPLVGVTPTADRAWLVNIWDVPTWVMFAAVGPAIVVAILLYLDQNITVRLVNSPDNRLSKGAGYHLDIAVIGVLVGACSLFGLPWMVAATVRSLNHVRSLANVAVDRDGKEYVTSVLENRVTNIAVNMLMAATVLLLPLVRKVPLSVLFGLFLFMGVASMSGNQFFERMRLWLLEPKRYPPTYYLRAVPTPTVHRYTAIQLLCLVLLWIVKASPISIAFPLFIGLLVPVRMVLDKLFKPEHLALLDSEEAPEEEEERFI